VRYRVEQLAAACDVSVDTVRYYQTRGLVPPPAREGRVAWYDDRHAERIREVRELRRRGLTLAAIERVLGDGLDPADADLAVARNDLEEAMQGVSARLRPQLIDEIPGAYKDIDEVMANSKELVAVEHTLKQILNVKGD
jgi:DNA-binding transcriptional MerR regulator